MDRVVCSAAEWAHAAPRLTSRHPSECDRSGVSPRLNRAALEGKRYKSLKRHLKGRGLTPEQYCEKWGLPREYPMVAPNYAKQRSELAKTMGLGQVRRKGAVAPISGGEDASTPMPHPGNAGLPPVAPLAPSDEGSGLT